VPGRGDETPGHTFVERWGRVHARDRTGGGRESGRLDRIEMRLNVDNGIVFVAVVVAAEPQLVRGIDVGYGSQGDQYDREQHTEAHANAHLKACNADRPAMSTSGARGDRGVVLKS